MSRRCCRAAALALSTALLTAGARPVQAFPTAGDDLATTRAGIQAPHAIEAGSITEVQTLRESAGADPSETVIVASVHCAAPKKLPADLGVLYNDAISWYLLREGRLVAWRHVAFRGYCQGIVEETRIDPPSQATRDAIVKELSRLIDPETAATLVDGKPESEPSPTPDPADAECAGTSAFREALRTALDREPTVHTAFVNHDLALTIAVESDGSYELEKVRPAVHFARMMVQQVRKVSARPDRPQAPACLRGKTVELAYPRAER
jgi:hypothetical protein